MKGAEKRKFNKLINDKTLTDDERVKEMNNFYKRSYKRKKILGIFLNIFLVLFVLFVILFHPRQYVLNGETDTFKMKNCFFLQDYSKIGVGGCLLEIKPENKEDYKIVNMSFKNDEIILVDVSLSYFLDIAQYSIWSNISASFYTINHIDDIKLVIIYEYNGEPNVEVMKFTKSK